MLFLGRLVPQKGIWTFLHAARLAPEIPCRVVGAGALEPAARAFVAENRLANVQVLGHKEGGELTEIIRGARGEVAPSEWYEPFGLVILEAMAAARPVIATRIAGPAEIVADREDGILVAPGHAEELAGAFRALWSDAERARAMGKNGRIRSKRNTAPKRTIRK